MGGNYKTIRVDDYFENSLNGRYFSPTGSGQDSVLILQPSPVVVFQRQSDPLPLHVLVPPSGNLKFGMFGQVLADGSPPSLQCAFNVLPCLRIRF